MTEVIIFLLSSLFYAPFVIFFIMIILAVVRAIQGKRLVTLKIDKLSYRLLKEDAKSRGVNYKKYASNLLNHYFQYQSDVRKFPD